MAEAIISFQLSSLHIPLFLTKHYHLIMRNLIRRKGIGSVSGYIAVGRQPKAKSLDSNTKEADSYYQWGFDGVTVAGTGSDEDDDSLILKSDSEEERRRNDMDTAVTVHCGDIGESDRSEESEDDAECGGYHGINLEEQCKDANGRSIVLAEVFI